MPSYRRGADRVLVLARLGHELGSLEAPARGRRVELLRHAGTTYRIHAKLNFGFTRLTLLELSGQLDPASARTAIRNLVEDMRGLAASLNAEELEQHKRRWRNNYVISLSNNAVVASGVLWELQRGRAGRSR